MELFYEWTSERTLLHGGCLFFLRLTMPLSARFLRGQRSDTSQAAHVAKHRLTSSYTGSGLNIDLLWSVFVNNWDAPTFGCSSFFVVSKHIKQKKSENSTWLTWSLHVWFVDTSHVSSHIFHVFFPTWFVYLHMSISIWFIYYVIFF